VPEDRRWQDSVDRRLADIEQQLHGKNGLGEKLAGLTGRVSVVLAVLTTLCGLIIAQFFTN